METPYSTSSLGRGREIDRGSDFGSGRKVPLASCLLSKFRIPKRITERWLKHLDHQTCGFYGPMAKLPQVHAAAPRQSNARHGQFFDVELNELHALRTWKGNGLLILNHDNE